MKGQLILDLPISWDVKHYRNIFFATYGFGPFFCVFCQEEVRFFEISIHHLDHNRDNPSIANLAATHQSCHKRHHRQEEA